METFWTLIILTFVFGCLAIAFSPFIIPGGILIGLHTLYLKRTGQA